MQNFYFTFGSHPAFPYSRNEYVQVIAPDMYRAIKTYQKYHPNREGSRLINCADYYSEATFLKFRDEFYQDKGPVEVLQWEPYFPAEEGEDDAEHDMG